ncbi:CHASE3 domain-containing protein [Niabella sp. CC-SYL272]|uniref:ATP-binding protein n=1 Tax=Niabella agricola TaxID=2891571 RepID=UPI001F46C06E|nr:ATP-binding protein [Niabella agricola]MCF3108326.1 CHASE3 domain-containing protein [Niabella agricola]
MILSLNKIRLGYALSSLLLLVSYILIFSTNRRLQQEKNWIVNNYTLINKMGAIKIAMSEAESNVRGYIINKQAPFLDSFYAARSALEQLHREMKKLTQMDPVQSANEDHLYSMTRRRLSELSSSVLLNRHSSAALRMSTVGQAKLAQADSIYEQIGKMTSVEEALMKKRMSKLNNFYTSTEAMTLLSLCMALIAVAYAVITFNSQYRQKKKANTIANQYRIELESNIKELSDKNTELNELKGIEKLAAIGRVSRVVAHEVRNPLTNITLATEQLRDLSCIEQDEEGQLLINIIKRNSTRISQMVADLLNATKFMQLDKQRENINDILDESLDMAKDRLLLQKIRVIKDYSPDLCDVMVDKERIKLAFLNIIVNAIEAMREEDGVLELVTRSADGKCIVEVRDNGSGMDENTLQNLFEPYFTLKSKGNGLGLTNTQNIVLNHKGSIRVQSAKGNGTIFTVSLDLA